MEEDQEKWIKAGQEARRATIAGAAARGITIDKVLLRLKQSLNAKQTKFFIHNGFIKETPKRTDHRTRLDAAKFIANLLDMVPSQKHDVEVGGSLADAIKEVNERRNGSGPITSQEPE